MMSSYRECCIGLSEPKTFKGSGSGVVYLRAVVQQPILKFIGILS